MMRMKTSNDCLTNYDDRMMTCLDDGQDDDDEYEQ
jgi:hypothetical protein